MNEIQERTDMILKTKIASLLIVLAQFACLIPGVSAQTLPGDKQMLMVSAYYSPLPGQTFYMRGSYEADIRLNGRGTNGADGTQVYTGMLAAPRSYPFGTRIKIPGLGVGEVHDRGGAIRSGSNYDRIDVWMGSGEDGLSRALNWGMRLVEGEVYYNANQVEPGLSFSWVSSTLPGSTLNRLKAKTLINPETFTKPITQLSPKTSIRELQDALRLFGYYHGEVDGNYDVETSRAVLTFQLDEGVILSAEDTGAGTFGPKTREALKSKSENFNSRLLKEQTRLKENAEALSAGLGKHSDGDDVIRLQQMLWELGYYRGDLNGFYDDITIDAVFEFQKEQGILESDREAGAGYFGKQTHAALVLAAGERAQKLANYPSEMQMWVPARIDLPQLTSLNAVTLTSHKSLQFDASFSAPQKPKNTMFSELISLNDRGDNVIRLQNILIAQGHLESGLNTGLFGYKTQEALIQFQIANGIVKKNTDQGAGLVGPKTRELLNSLI